MSAMFQRPHVAQPAPPPPSPVIEEEKVRARQSASDAAAMDLAVGGRRSTQFAGREMAMEDQMKRGKKRLGY
jgi:hypothetical protein